MLSKKEFYRQIVHIFLGLIIISLAYLEILSSLSLFLLIIISVLCSLISKRGYVPFYSSFINWFERDNVKEKFPGKGLVFYLVGSLLVLQLFERNIALAAIMVLALGDSLSHIIGGKWGKLPNIFNGKSKKLFEGTLAGIATGFLGALIFVPFPEAFLGASAAMIAEVIQIDLNQRSLDDNVVIPLIAGTVMFLVRSYI